MRHIPGRIVPLITLENMLPLKLHHVGTFPFLSPGGADLGSSGRQLAELYGDPEPQKFAGQSLIAILSLLSLFHPRGC